MREILDPPKLDALPPSSALRGADLALERAARQLEDIVAIKYAAARLINAIEDGKLRVPNDRLQDLKKTIATVNDLSERIDGDCERLRDFVRRCAP